MTVIKNFDNLQDWWLFPWFSSFSHIQNLARRYLDFSYPLLLCGEQINYSVHLFSPNIFHNISPTGYYGTGPQAEEPKSLRKALNVKEVTQFQNKELGNQLEITDERTHSALLLHTNNTPYMVECLCVFCWKKCIFHIIWNYFFSEIPAEKEFGPFPLVCFPFIFTTCGK